MANDDYDMLCDALDLVAEWLLAAYGQRLKKISLSIEGYYGPLEECYGIVPVALVRGPQPAARSRPGRRWRPWRFAVAPNVSFVISLRRSDSLETAAAMSAMSRHRAPMTRPMFRRTAGSSS